MANIKCSECGCECRKCTSMDHDVHLHLEIENLKQRLFERDNHIVKMETNFLNEANKFPNGEFVAVREELLTWQDKYKRLYEAHRRVQRVNQGLEDKLLKLVDVCETDKGTLTKDVATLSHKLAEANYSIKKLSDDNERYKNDVALAIQFLHCKPSSFVSQKFDTLPNEVQAKVSSYMINKRKPEERKSPPEIKSIKVPIPTFPPTAMVYSVPKSQHIDIKVDDSEAAPVDIVSAAIMARVLEERERERSCVKHCDTCTCSKTMKIIHHNSHHTVSTQTGDWKHSLCIKCNSNLEPITSIKLVKNIENNKNRSIPTYVHEHDLVLNNIAKVQPNNFRVDILSDSSKHSTNFQTMNLRQHPPAAEISNLILNERKEELNISIRSTKSDSSKLAPKETKKVHHYLCDKSTPTFEVESKEDKSSAKNSYTSDSLRGPRYCSMRVQSGSKNILLDNAHNNIAPVLYTKQQSDRKKFESVKIHEKTRTESCSSNDIKSSIFSEHSMQNQRVAEWIENNMEVTPSSCEHSTSESLKNEDKPIDPRKYAEMEKNVKKFLFGEDAFLQTVEIGKKKYQSYRDTDSAKSPTRKSRSNSHTETEI